MASSRLSKETFDNISVGLCEESNRGEAGDEISSVCSLIPAKLVKSLKGLALGPCGGDDKLDFTIARAQLLAFNRWKGFSELPEFTMLDGLDGDFAEEGALKEKTDSEGDNDDLSWVPEGDKRVSLRKRKPNSKYNEDDIVDDDVYEEIEDFDETKRVSLRKRKPNLKYNENDIVDDVYEEIEDFDETKRVSMRKRKPNSKYNEDDNVDDDVYEEIEDFDETKRVSSRKRMPNSKYREGEGTTRSWLLEEDVVGAQVLKDEIGSEGKKRVSSRKRKANTKYCEDEGEAHTGLVKENVVCFEGVGKDVSSPKRKSISKYDVEGIFPEENNGVSLRKRNLNTVYKEEMEEEDADSLVSEGRDDSEGVAKDGVWVPEGNNKRVSSRKRKANTKYNEDGDYGYDDAMEEHEAFQNSQINCVKSQRKKLILEEYPSSDGMLSQLLLAAKDPVKGYTLLNSLIGFFADYRNSFSQEHETIIGDNLEPETIERETNGVGYKDEKMNKDYTPTAVILFFVDVDSVPSKSDLHHVFGCYGDLNKANTEVVKRLRRARVVFKRRLDAENAFKGTGRFSIFGPSLVSYRLSYFYPE